MQKINKILFLFLFILVFLLVSCSENNEEQDGKNYTARENQKAKSPYYGFYPSKKGVEYKQLRHNIFGFSIDIPSNWLFGVHGSPPLSVILLYPEGMVTNKFADNYETIEIGKIPFQSTSLEDVQRYVMQGMNQKHPNLVVLKTPYKVAINKRQGLSWIFQWKSKNGYDIIEYITLIQYGEDTRSLAVRATKSNFHSKVKFYDEIIYTFKAYESDL